MGTATVEQHHKTHRAPKSGASSKNSSSKKKQGTSSDGKQQNPKAFAFSSSVKAKRLQSRAAEKEQHRLHFPTIDHSIGEPAPYVVVVHGTPKALDKMSSEALYQTKLIRGSMPNNCFIRKAKEGTICGVPK